MKTFLVTGGLGFIGSNICKLLLKKGHFVISIDNNSRTNRKNNKITSSKIKYIKADIDCPFGGNNDIVAENCKQ